MSSITREKQNHFGQVSKSCECHMTSMKHPCTYRLLLEEEGKASVQSQLELVQKKEKNLQSALQELARENEKLQVHQYHDPMKNH